MKQQHLYHLHQGITDYTEVLALQRKLAEAKAEGREKDHYLLTQEHQHVYTLGRNADATHLLATPSELEQLGAMVHEVERGGDITYHGPGQLVCYPILDLRDFGLAVGDYVRLIEAIVIEFLEDYQITGVRIPSAPGIWVNREKICAIGARVSRHITFHGFALNINTHLQMFNHIIPCGIADKGVTSLQKLLNRQLSIPPIAVRLAEIMTRRLSCEYHRLHEPARHFSERNLSPTAAICSTSLH